MHRIKLATILAAGPGAIMEVGDRLARREVILDGQGVTALAAEQLEFLFAALPAHWSSVEIADVIDVASLSPTVAEQLAAWVKRRDADVSRQADADVSRQVNGQEEPKRGKDSAWVF